MGASLAGGAISAGSSLLGGKKAKKAADKAQKRTIAAQKAAALQQQLWAKENSTWANDQNITNAGLENTANRENIGWANDLNKANQGWLQGVNRENIGWSNDLNRENQSWANDINNRNLQNQYDTNWEGAIRANDINEGNLRDQFNTNVAEQERVNAANRGNQEWAQGLNQAAYDRTLGQNRIGQSNAFGNTLSYDENGNQVQKFGGADQATLDALRGKRDEAVGGMGDFNIDNSVYNARKANMDQDLAARRGQQEARLAAMGLSTGSGSAWANAQRALGDTETRAQNELISGSVEDWNTEQNNLRSNLGALNSTEGNLRNNLGQADFWKQGNTATVNAPTMGNATMGYDSIKSPTMGYAGVDAPNAGTVTSSLGGINAPNYSIPGVSAPGTPSYDPMEAMRAGQVDGANTQQGWDSLGKGLGGITEAGLNWFNKQGDNGQPAQLSGPGAGAWSAY